MMGSGSPFEGMPGGIGERNGMIRLPYHPLTSLIRHFDNGQALALLHSGRGGRYSVLGLHAVIQTPRTPQPPTAAHGAATTIAPHTARPWNDSNRTCTTAKPT